MTRIIGRLVAALSLLAPILLLGGPAQAQERGFVSGTGNDANFCGRTSPCQTFNRAFAETRRDGSILCLDPSDYGGVSIDKSITIDCQGFAGIATSGTAILINFDNFAANDPLKSVRLRGLNISGTEDFGTIGIKITGAMTGTTVIIEDCVIDGHRQGIARGIDDQRSGGGKLIVTNTTIRHNSGGAVSVLPASGAANIQVLLNNVRAYKNGTGAQFGNLVRAVIDQSAFTGNTGAGILTVAGAVVQVDRSTISHNADGLQAAGGLIAIGNSNITLNTSQGVNVSGGSVVSFGNNRIAFNASPGTAPSPAGAASSDLGQQ
jgi:hypothetical protein